jgi:predicted ATPase/DNA-binding XRE family transcriptional regulator
MTDPNFFAQLIRERRKALRLTQADLAERVGLSFSAVQKLEGGQRRPSQQVAGLLAEALRIPANELPQFLRLAKDAADLDEQQSSPPSNLPAHLTALIGRDRELEEISALLKEGSEAKGPRLLTLTGPPGIGKTRLALQAASRVLSDFRDGVFLVTLASVHDPALVVQTIASALGLRDKGTEPISLTLRETLRDRKALLVLDNFEQVVAAAPSVVELLWSCPRIKMLVTSREALHVRGERRYQVSSLGREASVELFVERAQEVAAGFSLTTEEEGTVAEICARMEGVPLAIELVAARVRLMPPKALLARLHGQSRLAANPPHEGNGAQTTGGALPLLVGGQRDLPERHRTLRSAIAWSYELLSPAEQSLLRRLGVFMGGFTPTSAEAVCNARGDVGIDVFEGLGSLLDKNLLKRDDTASGNEASETSDEARYNMLETVREYAVERLVESGEETRVREWHAEYFLALARAAEPEVSGANQKRWFDTLEVEHANLRAALAWTLQRGELETGVRTACALYYYWYVHGHLDEGLRWFETLVHRAEASQQVPRTLLITALNDAGWLAIARSDFERALAWTSRSVALAREEGDAKALAHSLNRLATSNMYTGNFERAIPLFEESIRLLRELGDDEGLAPALNNYAGIHMVLGNLDDAVRFYQEALSISEKLKNSWNMSLLLGNIGHTLRRKGDYEQAAQACNQSLELAEGLDNSGLLGALARNCQGDVARYLGENERALELYRSSLAGSRTLQSHRIGGLNLLGMACLAAQMQQPERAAIFLAALEALVEKGNGALIAPVDRRDYDEALSYARDTLSEAAFRKAWARGRAMSLKQVTEYGLGEEE